MKKIRNERGSILMALVVTMPLVIYGLLAMANYIFILEEKMRLQGVVDAAALAAASDLSRIVIDDPHFGLISLSDYPAIGKATIAPDGQPLPVLGINTIVGTERLDLLIAKDSGMPDLIQDALSECQYSKEASTLLTKTLKAAVNSDTSIAKDIDGEPVSPKFAAMDMVEKLTGESQDLHLNISLGSANVSTVTPLPQPTSMAQVSANDTVSGNYQAFVDVPVGNDNFEFFGLAKQPALVNTSTFVPADNFHPASIVLVSLQSAQPLGFLPGLQQRLAVTAAAVPWAQTEIAPPGLLVFSTMVTQPLESTTLKSLADRSTGQGVVVQSQGGDFRKDSTAVTNTVSNTTGSQYLTQALLDWLRCARLRPRIDATASLLNQTIIPNSQLTVYGFTPEGYISSFCPQLDPFCLQPLSESQTEFTSLDAFGDSSDYRLTCQNQVFNLGSLTGGRHAGQPLPGDPINWADLSPFTEQAKGAGFSSASIRGMDCSITGNSGDCATPGMQDNPLAVSSASAVFVAANGHSILSRQPRKTYYAGGEAVLIAITQVDSNLH